HRADVAADRDAADLYRDGGVYAVLPGAADPCALADRIREATRSHANTEATGGSSRSFTCLPRSSSNTTGGGAGAGGRGGTGDRHAGLLWPVHPADPRADGALLPAGQRGRYQCRLAEPRAVPELPGGLLAAYGLPAC